MEHQQVSKWTIAYNSVGVLHILPIMITFRKKIGFSHTMEKKEDTLLEVVKRCPAFTIHLADRKAFPEMSIDGNWEYSKSVKIENFVIKCATPADANTMRAFLHACNSKNTTT